MFLKPSFLGFLLYLQPAGEVIQHLRLPFHFGQRRPADVPGNLSRGRQSLRSMRIEERPAFPFIGDVGG
jgi:hypothetical protein